jgi:CheY-like chemotaxis protein
MSDQNVAHILVVDDQKSLRDLSRVVLEAKGYVVSTAETAQEALDILGKGGVDLILSDVNMPNEDGFDLIKKVRSNPDLELIPVIFLTASMWSAEGKQSALQHGAVKVIFRPIEIRAIITEVEECLPVEKRSKQSL